MECSHHDYNELKEKAQLLDQIFEKHQKSGHNLTICSNKNCSTFYCSQLVFLGSTLDPLYGFCV